VSQTNVCRLPVSGIWEIEGMDMLRSGSNFYYEKRDCHGSSLVEFGPLVFLLLFMTLMPLTDLVCCSVGCCLANCASQYIAVQACKEQTFNSCLSQMVDSSNTYLSGALPKLLKIGASGGYLGCGSDIYVSETNIYSGNMKLYPAETLPTKIDVSSNVYEYCIKSKFNISPLLPVLFFSAVPGIGTSMGVQTAVYVPITDINGLIKEIASLPSNTSTKPNSTQWLMNSTLAFWNYPTSGGYSLLPGQKIEQQSTVVVPALSAAWVDSGIQVHMGQRIATSVSTKNQWQNHTGGLTNIYGDWQMARTANGFTVGSLIGRIGNDGTPFYVHNCTQFLSPASGELYFQMNDSMHTPDALDQVVTVSSTN
jgi:hypothetical protein